jgi:hypothetical protein
LTKIPGVGSTFPKLNCQGVHKTTCLIMCTLVSTRVLTHSRDSPDSPTSLSHFVRLASVAGICQTVLRDAPDSPHLPSHFARTRRTRQHSPKAIFEKNVTRLAKFARVTCESREFGASSHCLVLVHVYLTSFFKLCLKGAGGYFIPPPPFCASMCLIYIIIVSSILPSTDFIITLYVSYRSLQKLIKKSNGVLKKTKKKKYLSQQSKFFS